MLPNGVTRPQWVKNTCTAKEMYATSQEICTQFALHCVLFRLQWILPIVFRVTSLALGQWYDCRSCKKFACIFWMYLGWRGYCTWFPQTLKIAGLDFCLEKSLIFQSALKIGSFPWKVLEIIFIGLKNNGTTNLICLCGFYACCIFDFNKLKGFGNFVIKSPVTIDLVMFGKWQIL